MDWTTEVRPVLEQTYKLLEDHDMVNGEDVAAALGWKPDARLGRVWQRLRDAGYVDMQFVGADGLERPVMIVATEKGLQATSGWPSDAGGGSDVAALLSILDERLADESIPEEERGRLRRFRDAAATVSTTVLSEVIARLVEHQAGLGA